MNSGEPALGQIRKIQRGRRKVDTIYRMSPVGSHTRKKIILEELPNSSETEDMRKIR